MSTPSHPDPTGRRAMVLSGSATAVGVAALCAAVWVLGRRLWFFSDEWNILADYHSGHLLTPFNSHLTLVPVGMFQVLFHSVGVDSYTPYRLVGLAGIALLAAAVWRMTSRRVGPVSAVAVTWWLVGGSAGVTNLMFPFLVNFSLPIAALVLAWWLLDGAAPGTEPSTRTQVGVSACLAVALATSGLGLMAAAALGLELAIERASWRRWVVLAPGPVLWLLWYAVDGVDSPPNPGVGDVAAYAARMLWGGCRALGANHAASGAVVAVALLGVAAGAIRSRWVRPGRLAGAWSAPLLFVGLTAWSRTGVVPRIPPDELRYRWTVAAFLLLAAVSSLPPERRWLPRRTARGGLAAVAVLLVAGLVPLIGDCRRWARTVDEARPGLEAVVFATETGGDAVTAGRVVPLSFVPVTAGALRRAIADVGSPLERIDLTRWRGRPDQAEAADTILADGVRLLTRPPCAVEHPSGPGPYRVEPSDRVLIEGSPGARVRLRRFVGSDRTTGAVVELGDARGLLLPRDADSAVGDRPYLLEPLDGARLALCDR